MGRKWFPSKQGFISGLKMLGGIMSYLVIGVYALYFILMIYIAVDKLFLSRPYEREFICSDINVTKQMTQQELYDKLVDRLGITANINFYDNYAVVSYEYNGKKEKDVFKEIGEDEYEHIISPDTKITLKIDYLFGIILSATTQHISPSGTTTIIMKRNF